MSVDRRGRDALIEAILAFMRLEVRSDVFLGWCSIKSRDEGLERIRCVLGDFCDSYANHPISVTCEGWEMLRRAIAFLKTDLGVERVRWTIKHWRQWASAAGLVLLSGAFAAAGLTGKWRILVLAWLALGIVWVRIVPYPKFGPEVLEQKSSGHFQASRIGRPTRRF